MCMTAAMFLPPCRIELLSGNDDGRRGKAAPIWEGTQLWISLRLSLVPT